MNNSRIASAIFILFLLLVGCINETPAPPTPVPAEPIETDTPIEYNATMSAADTESTEEIPATPETPETLENGSNATASTDLLPEPVVQRPVCSREFSPQFDAEPYYTGPLFDAHFHMPPAFEEREPGFRFPVLGKDVTYEELLCLFDKENVTGSIAFYFPNFDALDRAVEDAAELKRQSPEGMHLFFMPGDLEASELNELLDYDDGVWEGFGEIVYYDPERPGATPDDALSMEIYALAGEHDWVVMIHPGPNQKAEIENVLQQNPDVKFLLHGHEIEDDIPGLMDRYPNAYYSLDSATLYHFDGMFMTGLEERFVGRFKQDFHSILNSKISKWKKQIERHPDRFMWGTDRSVDWHFSEEISILFEEFARAFTGRLDPEVQEKFAYKNAEGLFH